MFHSKYLKWVLIKGEYVIFVGQVNQDGKRTGKGVLINPNNVFAGVFKFDLPNGKGYTYNAKRERQYYAMYENGVRTGEIVTAAEEAEMKRLEEEERKRIEEEERKRREEEERRLEEERRRKEEENRKKVEEERRNN